ncbi:MAG TPA: energy transducer TonB, partial [Pyrinomonadaceae bacterium]|nr:energy transducer TonB [Pyrinomonadaceae bacterium]
KEVSMKRGNAGGFQVTIVDNASLFLRLTKEISFLAEQLREVWPLMQRDPVGLGRRVLAEAIRGLESRLTAPYSKAALMIAVFVISSGVMIILLGDRVAANKSQAPDGQREDLVQILEFIPDPKKAAKEPGIGAGRDGRVGFARGQGEGSAPERRRSTGGGSGGLNSPLPAQRGRLPLPSPIPAPIPALAHSQKQSLPVAGVDIDTALWQHLPMPVYGDPRSKSTTPSNGPGQDGGMGTAKGQGIGEGGGPGFGPGQDGGIGGNRKGPPGGGGPGGSHGSSAEDPDRVYPAPQVTERARVLAKPEPQYTEDARRNQITGSVVLRVVFSSTGQVTNIRAIQALPFGLTEQAIAAARQIRFRPATKDGRSVNVYMQLEYNFNLY